MTNDGARRGKWLRRFVGDTGWSCPSLPSERSSSCKAARVIASSAPRLVHQEEVRLAQARGRGRRAASGRRRAGAASAPLGRKSTRSSAAFTRASIGVREAKAFEAEGGFPATRRHGSSLASWKTSAMLLRPRSCGISTRTFPWLGATRCMSTRSSVDLPAPDGPTMATNSPLSRLRSRPSRILRALGAASEGEADAGEFGYDCHAVSLRRTARNAMSVMA